VALKTSWPKTVYQFQKPYFNDAVSILSNIHLKGVYKVKIEVLLTLNAMIKSLNLPLDNQDVDVHLKAVIELLEVINDSLATSKYPELQSQGLDLLHSTLSKTPEIVKQNSDKVISHLKLISNESENGMMKDKASKLLKQF
jgi:hypothetical protein